MEEYATQRRMEPRKPLKDAKSADTTATRAANIAPPRGAPGGFLLLQIQILVQYVSLSSMPIVCEAARIASDVHESNSLEQDQIKVNGRAISAEQGPWKINKRVDSLDQALENFENQSFPVTSAESSLKRPRIDYVDMSTTTRFQCVWK